jgi:hypothetical protein
VFKGKGFIDHLENDMVFKAIQQNKGERNLSKQGFVSTCLVPSCKMFIMTLKCDKHGFKKESVLRKPVQRK